MCRPVVNGSNFNDSSRLTSSMPLHKDPSTLKSLPRLVVAVNKRGLRQQQKEEEKDEGIDDARGDDDETNDLYGKMRKEERRRRGEIVPAQVPIILDGGSASARRNAERGEIVFPNNLHDDGDVENDDDSFVGWEDPANTFRLHPHWCDLVLGPRRADGTTSSTTTDDYRGENRRSSQENSGADAEAARSSGRRIRTRKSRCGYYASGMFGVSNDDPLEAPVVSFEDSTRVIHRFKNSNRQPSSTNAVEPFALSTNSLAALYSAMRMVLAAESATGDPHCAAPMAFGAALHPSAVWFEGHGAMARLRSLACPFEYLPYGAPIAAILHHHAAGSGAGKSLTSSSSSSASASSFFGFGGGAGGRRRGIAFVGDSMTRHLFSHIIMSLRGFDKYGDRHFHEDCLYVVFSTHDEQHVLTHGSLRSSARLRALMGHWFEGYASRHAADRWPPRRPYFGNMRPKHQQQQQSFAYGSGVGVGIGVGGGDSEEDYAEEAKAPLFALLFMWDTQPEDILARRQTQLRNLALSVGGYHYWPTAEGGDGARVYHEFMDSHLARHKGQKHIISTIPWLRTLSEPERLARNHAYQRWAEGSRDYATRRPLPTSAAPHAYSQFAHNGRGGGGKHALPNPPPDKLSPKIMALNAKGVGNNTNYDNNDSAYTGDDDSTGDGAVAEAAATTTTAAPHTGDFPPLVQSPISPQHPARVVLGGESNGEGYFAVNQNRFNPAAAAAADGADSIKEGKSGRVVAGTSPEERGKHSNRPHHHRPWGKARQKYILDFATFADVNVEFGSPIPKISDRVHYKCALTSRQFEKGIVNVTENGIGCRDPMNEGLMQWLLQLLLRL